MSISVKKFRLKISLSNDEIAKKLGVANGERGADGVFSTADDKDEWVGSRITKNVFALASDNSKLHRKARKFADEIRES